MLLLTVTSTVWWLTYVNTRVTFFSWYSLGLVLLALGIAAVDLQRQVGGVADQTGRVARVFANAYLLIAVVSVMRFSTHGTARGLGITLRQSGLAYRHLAEAASEAVLAVDHKGAVLYGNEAALRLATDRYRMVVQSLPLDEAEECPSASAVVTATALQRLGPWLRQQEWVRLEFDQAPGLTAAPAGAVTTQVRLVSAREERMLAAVPAPFPDYRMLLDHLPASVTRILASRRGLLAATRDAGEGLVRWDADPRRGLHVSRPGLDRRAISVDAEIRGDGVVLGFDPARLRAVLAEGVGPDLRFEIARPDQPVVIRSADRTGITTLLMPMPVFPGPGTAAHDSTGAA